MSIGRNDPCPCGSGKKYKKCHGALDREPVTSPDAARATALKARDVALGERLMRFARARYGPHWLHDALDSADLLDDDELSEVELPLVIPWLLHSCVGGDGLTLADEWRAHERRPISTDDCLLLDAYDAAWVSIWEVAEVQAGVGSRLRDVLTHEERFVHDVASTAMLRRFDSLLAIVLTVDGVSFFGGAHAQPLSPRFAEHAVREAKRLCHVRTRPVAPARLRDTDMQLELLALWSLMADAMVHQPPPTMQNTDGDPFVLTRDDFALVASRREVTEQLVHLEGTQEPERDGGDTVFAVTRAGNPIHRSWDNTVVGRIVVSGARMTVETNSTRRADWLRAAVEKQLRGLVRFRLRTEENTAQLMVAAQTAASVRPERANEATPPELMEALRKSREQYMTDWLDMSIPALGGLTPREAARLPRARMKLETLLKEMEQSEEKLPKGERIELGWLRETLESG